MTQQDLIDWVSFLSEARAEFGGLPPCPFALKALTDNKVALLPAPVDTVETELLLKRKEVVIYWHDPADISAAELTAICDKINTSYPGLVALEDHPEDLEQVSGVTLNQAQWALILIQDRHKLERARAMLKRTDYYKNWSWEYLSDVLGM